MLVCPKCHEQLVRENNSYKCANGHCYDMAKEGYVNLVLANQKHSRNPGDDSESLRSRQRFLERGYYSNLAACLCEVIQKYLKDNDSFLDAGCGTGYYLHHLINNSGLKLKWYACDLAKKGVAMCSKANEEAVSFVGNVFHLPFNDESLEGLMSVFCPYSGEEFARVIKTGGIVIAVTPGPRHLYQLKEIVYDEPYLNEGKGYDLPGFEHVETRSLNRRILLADNEDINTLWRMTPYFHKTSLEGNQRLLTLDSVETETDFLVSIYRKVQ